VARKSLKAIEIFFSYSHEDEELRKELGKHIEVLKQQKFVSDWHDRKITAGSQWQGQIDEHLNSAHIILLLVSVDFLVSGYIKDVELRRAMARHRAAEARVIPVILRECMWEKESFGKLQALPPEGLAVTLWPNRDVALTEVASGIGLVIEELRQKPSASDGGGKKTDKRHKSETASKTKRKTWALSLRRSPDSELSKEEMQLLVENAVIRAEELVRDVDLRNRICRAAKVLLRKNKGQSLSKEQLEQLDKRFLQKREERKEPDPKKIRWVLRAARLHPQGRRIVIPRRASRA